MARPKKFNFAKILMNGGGTAKEDTGPTMSLYKNGQVVLNRAANHTYGLDGKAIEILWDAETKAFGFRKVEHIPMSEGWTKTMRILKADPKHGFIKVAVGKILSRIEHFEKVTYKAMPLEVYVDVMEKREVYYSIIRKKKSYES
jgi:hypothetical protein